jgi:hypothetical protein
MSDYINFNDMTIDSSYWDTVLNELTNYNNLCQENFYTKGYRVVYLVRLWCRRTDSYLYKVGSSENFAQRVRELNRTYDSCGRVIVVAAGIVSSLFDESLMHSALESYRSSERVQPFHKDREVYELNYDVYDTFVWMLEEHLDELSRFVSENYNFKDDGTEMMYVEDEDADLETTDGMVELDCDEMEQDYWVYRRSI